MPGREEAAQKSGAQGQGSQQANLTSSHQGSPHDIAQGKLLLAQADLPPGEEEQPGESRKPDQPTVDPIERANRNDENNSKDRVERAGGSSAEVKKPGPPTEESKTYWRKAAENLEDAKAAETNAQNMRTKTDRLIQHTQTDDLVGAAREIRSGVPQGGQHVKEVSEAADGLMRRIDQIQNGLSNPKLPFERRVELMQELSKASKALDSAQEALKGNYPRHSQ
jgi:hypothetical protein